MKISDLFRPTKRQNSLSHFTFLSSIFSYFHPINAPRAHQFSLLCENQNRMESARHLKRLPRQKDLKRWNVHCFDKEAKVFNKGGPKNLRCEWKEMQTPVMFVDFVDWSQRQSHNFINSPLNVAFGLMLHTFLCHYECGNNFFFCLINSKKIWVFMEMKRTEDRRQIT